MAKISKRLLDVVDALPLKEGIRILEIGCGPGVAAREIVNRLNSCFVLAIDRSPKAIAQAVDGSEDQIKSGKLAYRQAAIESFELAADEEPFDIAFAIRVGAIDGRHPELEKKALENVTKALKKRRALLHRWRQPFEGNKIRLWRIGYGLWGLGNR